MVSSADGAPNLNRSRDHVTSSSMPFDRVLSHPQFGSIEGHRGGGGGGVEAGHKRVRPRPLTRVGRDTFLPSARAEKPYVSYSSPGQLSVKNPTSLAGCPPIVKKEPWFRVHKSLPAIPAVKMKPAVTVATVPEISPLTCNCHPVSQPRVLPWERVTELAWRPLNSENESGPLQTSGAVV